MAFPTPVASYEWPSSTDLNHDLEQEILRRSETEAGLARSNAGGWHSAADLLNWNTASTDLLRDRIGRIAAELVAAILTPDARAQNRAIATEAWANVSREGDYNAPHDHPGAHWSGVYYVSSGLENSTSDTAGKLELLDPRLGVNMVPLEGSATRGRMLIAPIPGLMVCFPSWVKHYVHPFSGPGTRISIAFNVTVVPKARTS